MWKWCFYMVLLNILLMWLLGHTINFSNWCFDSCRHYVLLLYILYLVNQMNTVSVITDTDLRYQKLHISKLWTLTLPPHRCYPNVCLSQPSPQSIHAHLHIYHITSQFLRKSSSTFYTKFERNRSAANGVITKAFVLMENIQIKQ